jgi:hypothetical protein
MCKRIDKHDREKCPYAHPGELARRRHPSLYKALPCPEARAVSVWLSSSYQQQPVGCPTAIAAGTAEHAVTVKAVLVALACCAGC